MKSVILTENQKKYIDRRLNEEMSVAKKGKPYSINPDKVLIVKKYLDNSFKRGSYENIGSTGFPEKIPVYAMIGSTGEVLQTMKKDRMIDLLVDKYKKMFSDDSERELFMNQVLDDWYNNKIGIFGQLSVNHL